ncbi:hypothetical protein J6590_030208 [Homalodisca vitripennis]|nr:hypothetical protein J6590_030208 [Homalodisca vitripennis]
MGYSYLTTPIEELELSFNLHPLHTRRQLQDLQLLYKLVNGKLDCPDLLRQVNFYIPRGTRSKAVFGRVYRPTSYASNCGLACTGGLVCDGLDFFQGSWLSFKWRDFPTRNLGVLFRSWNPLPDCYFLQGMAAVGDPRVIRPGEPVARRHPYRGDSRILPIAQVSGVELSSIMTTKSPTFRLSWCLVHLGCSWRARRYYLSNLDQTCQAKASTSPAL